MPDISHEIIKKYFDAGNQAKTTFEKGRALEDLVCYLFEQVPGVSIGKRNTLNIGNKNSSFIFLTLFSGFNPFTPYPFLLIVNFCKVSTQGCLRVKIHF